jgi:hypothetical protein
MRCRRPLIPSALVAVALVALLAAGCGGGSPGVASVTSSTTTAATTATQNGLVAFSRCMRSNGLPNFPDPRALAGGNAKLTVHQLGNSPHVQAAMSACDHLLPTRGSTPQQTAQQARTQIADELSFASCMRSHGVSRFPDPTAQGQLSVEMVQAHGIDVHSSAVLQVVQACLPASHGALTPAKVREALNNCPPLSRPAVAFIRVERSREIRYVAPIHTSCDASPLSCSGENHRSISFGVERGSKGSVTRRRDPAD